MAMKAFQQDFADLVYDKDKGFSQHCSWQAFTLTTSMCRGLLVNKCLKYCKFLFIF